MNDDFYREVGRWYATAVTLGQRPAKSIADATGRPVTTVHRWIREARQRGVMPPSAGKGRTGGVTTCPTCKGRGRIRQVAS